MAKVLVSQWAQEAAHKLDTQRETWLARQAKSDFIVAELQGLRVDSRLDHTHIVSASYADASQLYLAALADASLLRTYLGKLNAEKNIAGRWVPKRTFDMFRARVAAETEYKSLIASVCKHRMKDLKFFASDAPPGSPGADMSDLELLEAMRRVMVRILQRTWGGEWFTHLTPEEQAEWRQTADAGQQRLRWQRLLTVNTEGEE